MRDTIVNNYPYWRYRRIATVPGAAFVSAVFSTMDNEDYLLQKVNIKQLTVGVAPSTFTDLEAKIYFSLGGIESNELPIPFMLASTPGRTENFVGSGKKNNGAWLNSLSLNYPFLAKTSFEIRISNMATVGSNAFDLMLYGRNVKPDGKPI